MERVTNGDRIRAMSDEMLAEQIVRCVESDLFRLNVIGIRPNNKEEWLDWLREKAYGESDGRAMGVM